jgi:hypothetical protein
MKHCLKPHRRTITGLILVAGCIALITPAALTQPAATPAPIAPQPLSGAIPQLITGHPFTAIKYARRVRVLPDRKLQFIRNERYPTRIARDADGRLMMQVQVIQSDHLFWPECDRLDMPVPPACPDWRVFVIDPVAHSVSHWQEGERGGKEAATFPLTQSRLDEAADVTSALPALEPDFSLEDGEVDKVDLGDETLEGIPVHGARWTARRSVNQDGHTVYRVRIHEVWTSKEMQLIMLVIDGDPNGEEKVWGLEKISLAPDASLFRPPDGYGTHHISNADTLLGTDDFEDLKSWFAQ